MSDSKQLHFRIWMTSLGERMVHLWALGSKSVTLLRPFPFSSMGQSHRKIAISWKLNKKLWRRLGNCKILTEFKLQDSVTDVSPVIRELCMMIQFTVPACILADRTLFLNVTFILLHRRTFQDWVACHVHLTILTDAQNQVSSVVNNSPSHILCFSPLWLWFEFERYNKKDSCNVIQCDCCFQSKLLSAFKDKMPNLIWFFGFGW